MSIYPDKDKQGNLTGKYCVAVQLKGNRMRSRFNSLPEAQAAEVQWKTELATSVVSPNPRAPTRLKPLMLQELFDLAKESLWKGRSTERQSLARCQTTIDYLGHGKLLHTLSAVVIDDLIKHLQHTMSDASVNRYLSALHTLLKWGSTRHYISSIPAFTWQKEEEGRIRWITEAEEAKLLKLLPPQIGTLVSVAIATGCRRNEILGLKKDNVEPTWIRLWKTKNGKPRSVPITPETYKLILKLLKSMPTQNQLRYAWDAAKKTMGLQNDELFVFHACRHTCATRLVRNNINIRIIQTWLGHKRIETTLRYSHVNDTMLADALAQTQTTQDLHQMSSAPSAPHIPQYATHLTTV